MRPESLHDNLTNEARKNSQTQNNAVYQPTKYTETKIFQLHLNHARNESVFRLKFRFNDRSKLPGSIGACSLIGLCILQGTLLTPLQAMRSSRYGFLFYIII